MGIRLPFSAPPVMAPFFSVDLRTPVNPLNILVPLVLLDLMSSLTFVRRDVSSRRLEVVGNLRVSRLRPKSDKYSGRTGRANAVSLFNVCCHVGPYSMLPSLSIK